MMAILEWTHETTSIPDRGLKTNRAATGAERAALAQTLDLIACDRLDVAYTIEAGEAGTFRLTGEIDADVVQACIVTLEPVPSRLREPFAIIFRRDAGDASRKTARTASDGEADQEILSGEDVEPLDRDTIAVGRIVYETFSAALDPYPRKPDASFEWRDPRAEQDQASNPFAALKNLKKDA